MPTKAASRNLNSVTNALAVLEYLVEAGEAGVSEIGRHVGVTVGTAHRLVATLVATGFAEQNPENRKYRPSHKLIALAQRARLALDARGIAHEHLVKLGGSVHETVNLAILSERLVLYTDKVTSDQPFGIEARIGSRLPAYCTALGKVLIGGLGDDDVAAYLATLRRNTRTDQRTPPREADLRAELMRVREKGFALDHGDYLPDVYCAAAPVLGANGQVVAALSVSAPRSRFRSNQRQLVAEVRRSAAELSAAFAELGLPGSPGALAAPDL